MNWDPYGEFHFFNEVLIGKEKEIQEKVSFAKDNALSTEEHQNSSIEYAKMWSIKKEREFTEEEISHFASFLRRIQRATIFVETLSESRRVMELLYTDPDHINHILAHENAHGNKADDLGGEHVGHEFLLYRNLDGNLLISPRAKINVPKAMSNEEERLFKIKVLTAPDEYGNKMSEEDKMDIQKLQS